MIYIRNELIGIGWRWWERPALKKKLIAGLERAGTLQRIGKLCGRIHSRYVKLKGGSQSIVNHMREGFNEAKKGDHDAD